MERRTGEGAELRDEGIDRPIIPLVKRRGLPQGGKGPFHGCHLTGRRLVYRPTLLRRQTGERLLQPIHVQSRDGEGTDTAAMATFPAGDRAG